MQTVTPMEIKDVKQLASQFKVISAYLVPFEHESRKLDDNTPAIWYRVVVDIQVSSNLQSIVLITSRRTLRQFANVTKALEFVDSELEDGKFERISILRDINNAYNEAINELKL